MGCEGGESGGGGVTVNGDYACFSGGVAEGFGLGAGDYVAVEADHETELGGW